MTHFCSLLQDLSSPWYLSPVFHRTHDTNWPLSRFPCLVVVRYQVPVSLLVLQIEHAFLFTNASSALPLSKSKCSSGFSSNLWWLSSGLVFISHWLWFYSCGGITHFYVGSDGCGYSKCVSSPPHVMWYQVNAVLLEEPFIAAMLNHSVLVISGRRKWLCRFHQRRAE